VERADPRLHGIETQYGPAHVEADSRFAKAKFDQALELCRHARGVEDRAWVKRQITVRMVWCYRNLGQIEPACREFLALVGSDPDTPGFACIPLAWEPSEPPMLLEQSSREWLNTPGQLPAASLLGASHLLSTSSQGKAMARLKGLKTHSDRRIAQLALAQTWRVTAVTADDAQLTGWEATIEGMPEPLRPGPYFVLGGAWDHRQAWERAALAWMRVPILYPEHRRLAARSLLSAGRSLEKLNRADQAATLYTELAGDYADTPLAAEARKRLEGESQ
jgi:hypothetical protein